LDAFGIINMNGRVYDPSTAQFFSPDPFIQSGGDWINYNRYGYCFDNPLTNTDPSGYVKEPNDDGYVPKLMPANCYYYGSQIYRGYNSGFTYGGTSSPYTYDWNNGIYKDSQGNFAAYWEVSNNYIQPNSTRATSDQIITALNTVQSGQKFYSVQFGSGFTSYATSYGDIGNATVSSNGGLNFSNPTAAMTSLSFWAEGRSGGNGNKIRNDQSIENAKSDPWFTFGTQHGVPYVEVNFLHGGAITPGPFVIYPKGGSKIPYYNTHEPGHVLQFMLLGALYYPLVAIPSLITSNFNFHKYTPWEMSANQLWYWYSGESDEKENKLYYGPNK